MTDEKPNKHANASLHLQRKIHTLVPVIQPQILTTPTVENDLELPIAIQSPRDFFSQKHSSKSWSQYFSELSASPTGTAAAKAAAQAPCIPVLPAGDPRCSGSSSACPAQPTAPPSQTWRRDAPSSPCRVGKLLLQLLLNREQTTFKRDGAIAGVRFLLSIPHRACRACFLHPSHLCTKGPRACQMLHCANSTGARQEGTRTYFTTWSELWVWFLSF